MPQPCLVGQHVHAAARSFGQHIGSCDAPKLRRSCARLPRSIRCESCSVVSSALIEVAAPLSFGEILQLDLDARRWRQSSR
jgi:hypothetical protein